MSFVEVCVVEPKEQDTDKKHRLADTPFLQKLGHGHVSGTLNVIYCTLILHMCLSS